MPFPFTFSFSVPGLHNPFTATQPAVQQSRTDRNDALLDPAARAISRRDHPFPPSHRAYPSSSLVPLTRKRAWVPSTSEPSQAATSGASITGYLDTPAKYRHMVHEAPERETEEMFAGGLSIVHSMPYYVLRAISEHAHTMWFCASRSTCCTCARATVFNRVPGSFFFTFTFRPTFVHAYLDPY